MKYNQDTFYNTFEKTPCLLRLGMNHAVAFRANNHIKIHSVKSVFGKSVFLIVSRKDMRILGNIYEKPEYWTGAHTKHRLKYHIVFIPKYRKYRRSCTNHQMMKCIQNKKNSFRVGRVFMVRFFRADGYFAESV